MDIRIGFGVDVHRLEAGRDFVIGGVKLPATFGAVGHSDADVLIHAICDALLGAACLGDIGVHFPDTSLEFKNIDSKILLAKTRVLIEAEGYSVGNIDASLCLEAPKIKPYVVQMQETIAGILGIGIKDVSIKATTTETMGFVGRQEGLVAHAVCLIHQV
jgi:2-C-methyl-D-erythritol 2,4-cyclodiphosphate synthase